MKKISFTLSFFFAIACLFAQNPFYDGQYLFEKLDPNNQIVLNTDVQELLAKYFPEVEFFDINQNVVNENPFLNGMFLDHGADATGDSLDPGMKSFGHSSIGGLNVTKLVNALADIMIERAKQELTIAFFDRFKKFANENTEFQILFPQTTSNLDQLLVFQYPQMMPALRNGFFEDLKQITYHLDDVLELPRYQTLLQNYPEVTVAIRSLRLIHELETEQANAADILTEFAGFDEWKMSGGINFKNMGSTIRFASLFSESLRNSGDTAIWISHEDIRKLVRDERMTRLYTGLLYQQVKNEDIRFFLNEEDETQSASLADLMGKQKNNLILFQNKVSEFIGLAAKVESSYAEIKWMAHSAGRINHEQAYTYINVSIDVIDYGLGIVKIFDEKLVTDQYLSLARKSNGLFRDIYNEQYTQAVNDAVDILEEVHDLIRDHPQSLSLESAGKKPGLESLLTFTNKVKPYALFMANVVEARSEAEIKSALENVILPVGSSSIKKHTQGNLAIQSYLGAFVSVSKDENSDGIWSDPFGVTAPIGIAWTPAVFSWNKGGSLSLFGALLDIGAVVDYKLKREPDASSSDPDDMVIVKDYKVELGQIFSPGMYAVYGFGANLPLSLAIGAQYGPGLSKIDQANNVALKNPTWRYNLFLTVDLPLFNLYNQPKRN